MTEIWTNWAGQQHCAPSAIARPRSEHELIEVVTRAAATGQRVRAVGAGHSFTDTACTDGVMVDLSLMDRILEADRSTGLVTVQSGIRLHALGPALAKCGLALEKQGDIDRQSLAGALATATHGTGVRFPNMSAQVAGMRLVTADGKTIDLTAQSDPDTLRAARVSVGSLGIVSAVTLRCLPQYTLRRHDQPRPLDQTLERLDEYVDANDHFELFVFPYTHTANTRTMVRSDAVPQPTPQWRRWIHEDLVENRVMELVCRMGRRRPDGVPRLNRLMAAAMSESHVTDRPRRVYASTRNVRFTEMEYAIPRAHARATRSSGCSSSSSAAASRSCSRSRSALWLAMTPCCPPLTAARHAT